MTTINDYFDGDDPGYSHPKLNYWRALSKKHGNRPAADVLSYA